MKITKEDLKNYIKQNVRELFEGRSELISVMQQRHSGKGFGEEMSPEWHKKNKNFLDAYHNRPKIRTTVRTEPTKYEPTKEITPSDILNNCKKSAFSVIGRLNSQNLLNSSTYEQTINTIIRNFQNNLKTIVTEESEISEYVEKLKSLIKEREKIVIQKNIENAKTGNKTVEDVINEYKKEFEERFNYYKTKQLIGTDEYINYTNNFLTRLKNNLKKFGIEDSEISNYTKYFEDIISQNTIDKTLKEKNQEFYNEMQEYKNQIIKLLNLNKGEKIFIKVGNDRWYLYHNENNDLEMTHSYRKNVQYYFDIKDFYIKGEVYNNIVRNPKYPRYILNTAWIIANNIQKGNYKIL